MSTLHISLISLALNEVADRLVLLYVIGLKCLGIVFMQPGSNSGYTCSEQET